MLEVIPLRPVLASKLGAQTDTLFFFLTGMSVFFCVLIFGTIFYFAIRYRRRDQTIPPVIKYSIPLEVSWIAIPLVLTGVIFVWGARQFFRESEPPQGAIEILVVGKQWMWHLQHSGGQREINELHIPVDTPVKLTMTSEDVIHDFFVPAFRDKEDVVPGRYTTEWFTATKVGRYHFFCAQYCGTMHSLMRGWVDVMDPKDYAAWLVRNKPAQPPSAVGERLFEKLACTNCHQTDGSGSGPSLEGIFGTVVTLKDGRRQVVDNSFLREKILDPGSLPIEGYPQVMPSFRGEITEQEILDVAAFIKSTQQQGAK